MDIFSKFTILGILFVLTVAFGFWLSHLGKPYNGILFNIHKLVALGAVIVAISQLFKMITVANPISLVVVFLILAAICTLVLFASGALMSAGKLDYTLMLTIHRVAPVLLTIAMAMAGYLLARTP
ncbi:MAG: hypothetical protein CVU44_06225 [Chloroflexi bacterium HGW-Chloroflexi-6]|nr:MAG: hypothetical protein CVU44_06225 [Chloroflexi bacterium HGW-Chloroflexi-6]